MWCGGSSLRVYGHLAANEIAPKNQGITLKLLTQFNTWDYSPMVFTFFEKLIRICSRPKYKSVDRCVELFVLLILQMLR